MPDATAISEALVPVGAERVILDSTSTHSSRTVRLSAPGMRLDLGGIAKGYAVDRAFEMLTTAGNARVLVDGGGDLRVGDPPPGRDGWTIAVADSGSVGARQARLVHVSNTALAQSGATYRYVERDGVRYSHIVDPRTGYGMSDDRIVTVQAPTCMEADALASALSVAPVGLHDEILDRHAGARAWVVVND